LSIIERGNMLSDQRVKSEFRCRQCGACCRWPGNVLLTDEDIAELANFLKLSEVEFIRRYTRLATNRKGLSLREGAGDDCVFLEAMRCRVYAARPQQCRNFPWHWRTESGCSGLEALGRDEA